MKENKFNTTYNNIINEIKHITNLQRDYIINDDAFKPILYKDVCIVASSLNADPFHILKQIQNRSNGKYSINDVLTIVKRYIDQDPELKNLFKDNNRSIYSCSIHSKEFCEIKVQVMFELNKARDIFSSDIESAKYFCFIYTVLSNKMKENKNDIPLITEEINIEVN